MWVHRNRIDKETVCTEEAPAAAASYKVEYYKNNNSIGIKTPLGNKKKQILSFGGKKSEKTEAELREIAKRVVKLLCEGTPIAEAKQKGNELSGVLR